jgi:hypothetical protein
MRGGGLGDAEISFLARERAGWNTMAMRARA